MLSLLDYRKQVQATLNNLFNYLSGQSGCDG